MLLEEEPVLGASVARFEEEFAAYLGCAHAVGVGSGTDALVLALRALELPAGAEGIAPSNTFVATVHAIRLAGLTPVLVEPDPDSMVLDAAGVAAALTPRTAAVIPVHLYGHPCAVGELEGVLAGRDVAVVEDAAQAHGARLPDGRRAGAAGRLGCFSFHPSKNLGAFGDGGLVATSEPGLAERLRVLRNLGKDGKYAVPVLSSNSKLDTLQAALLRLKLGRLEESNARRRAHAERYAAALEGVGDLVLPRPVPGHAWHLYVVRTARRDALREHLRQRGVRASLHYPVPPHLQESGRSLGYPAGSLPVAEECAARVLSLPVAPELEDQEVDRVCAAVAGFFDA